MKTTKIILLCACFSAMCNSACAQGVSYDKMRTAIIDFLDAVEEDFEDRGSENILSIRNDVSDYQIGNIIGYQNGEEVLDGIYSFFPISSFSEYTYAHILLVDKDCFLIVNMRNHILNNLDLLLDFMEDNPMYTKEKMLAYIRDFIRVSDSNTERS